MLFITGCNREESGRDFAANSSGIRRREVRGGGGRRKVRGTSITAPDSHTSESFSVTPLQKEISFWWRPHRHETNSSLVVVFLLHLDYCVSAQIDTTRSVSRTENSVTLQYPE